MAAKFDYNGTSARVASNSSMLNHCLHSIKGTDRGLKDKYRDFLDMLRDKDVVEVLTYKDNRIKGRRRIYFDFCANSKLYMIIFIYVLLYKGLQIY